MRAVTPVSVITIISFAFMSSAVFTAEAQTASVVEMGLGVNLLTSLNTF